MANAFVNTSNDYSVDVRPKQAVCTTVTVGQVFDEEIKRVKQQLERLTIAKAKAETLGMLNYPHSDLRDILGYVI